MKRQTFHDMQKYHKIKILMSINKILLEHIHLTTVCGCFHTTTAESESHDRVCMAYKAPNFTLLHFIVWPKKEKKKINKVSKLPM